MKKCAARHKKVGRCHGDDDNNNSSNNNHNSSSNKTTEVAKGNIMIGYQHKYWLPIPIPILPPLLLSDVTHVGKRFFISV
jgi:hypothetical protein